MPAHGEGGVGGGAHSRYSSCCGAETPNLHTRMEISVKIRGTDALKGSGSAHGLRATTFGYSTHKPPSIHPSIHPSRGWERKKVEVAGRRRRRRKKATNSCLLFCSHVKSCLTHRCHPLVRFHSHVGIKEGRKGGRFARSRPCLFFFFGVRNPPPLSLRLARFPPGW